MGISIYVENGSQADRILRRFGNARRLAQAISEATGKICDPSRVYKWRMPREKGGTGGLIPASAIPDVIAAARHFGVLIPEADWSPKSDPRGDL